MVDKVLKHLDPTQRAGLENLSSLTFVSLVVVYVGLYVGEYYALLKRQMVAGIPELARLKVLDDYGLVFVVLIIFARVFLFGHDTLANGRDKYAQFFQQSLPSTFLAERLGCARGVANELWFKFFNVWKSPSHPRNPQWYATFRRTYSCRFLYFLTVVHSGRNRLLRNDGPSGRHEVVQAPNLRA
jgi:hypothetical protein